MKKKERNPEILGFIYITVTISGSSEFWIFDIPYNEEEIEKNGVMISDRTRYQKIGICKRARMFGK